MKKIFLCSRGYCSFSCTKSFLFVLSFILSASVIAQQKIIHLYKGDAPGSENWNWQEKQSSSKNTPVIFPIAYNVTKPTLTVFLPDSASANGTGIILFPGGGFYVLNIEHEGSKVAKELNRKGITVFLLKYRVAHSLTDDPWQEMMNSMKDSMRSREKITAVKNLALEDAKAAMLYVRQNATEYKVDENKIGVIGFSAGGGLSRSMALDFTPETRPAFAAVIYAGISPKIKPEIPDNAPPLFIAAAADDILLPVSYNINLYNLWIAAKQKAEIHLYAKGGHGLWGAPANTWIFRLEEWLAALGF